MKLWENADLIVLNVNATTDGSHTNKYEATDGNNGDVGKGNNNSNYNKKGQKQGLPLSEEGIIDQQS